MAKYDGWTLGETEALLNKVGGVDVARAVLRSERRLVVEAVVPPQPAPKPQLVGRVVKVLHLNPFQVKSFADAVKRGNYDNDTAALLVRQCGDDHVGLEAEVDIHLVQFDRDSWHKERLAWGKERAQKPMESKHLLGIGIQHPEEQRRSPIVEDGSVWGGFVFCLDGHSNWRSLDSDTVTGDWRHRCLFGFLSE